MGGAAAPVADHEQGLGIDLDVGQGTSEAGILEAPECGGPQREGAHPCQAMEVGGIDAIAVGAQQLQNWNCASPHWVSLYETARAFFDGKYTRHV